MCERSLAILLRFLQLKMKNYGESRLILLLATEYTLYAATPYHNNVIATQTL
jgi:hypothetical protein